MTPKLNLTVLPILIAGMSVASEESRWGDQHRWVIKLLRNNNNLVISKPDKDAGVVLLDHAMSVKCY